MVDIDRFYMQAAIDEAWKYQLLTYPNPAVGAAVVKDGRLLSISAHKEAGAPHAEVEAIKEAYFRLTGDKKIFTYSTSYELHDYLLKYAKELFEDATIYVSLEPCNHYGKTPPCASLIESLGFQRLIIGTLDPNEKASGGAMRLQKKGVDVVVGVCQKEAEALIEPFVRWSEQRFVVFKLAQTINGVISGGTISSRKSRQWVHRVRSKIDLLVIGGNTVRVDRPILDARLARAAPPDILIYSKEGALDPDIPLFHVPGRKVLVKDSFDILDSKRFVMIEGGAGMLEATKELVDWYLFFMAPSMKMRQNYLFERDMEFVKVVPIGEDLMVWSRNG